MKRQRTEQAFQTSHIGVNRDQNNESKSRDERDALKNPARIPVLTPGPVNVTYNCLLVPVVLAVWWFWFKRKTKRVITRLLHTEPQEAEDRSEYDCDDGDGSTSEFSSWDEVAENETRDSSVQFVRWIKRHREMKSTTRQRASLVLNSRRTLRLASSPRSLDGLKESMLDDEISLEEAEPESWQDIQNEKCLSPTGPFASIEMTGGCSNVRGGSSCLGDIA